MSDRSEDGKRGGPAGRRPALKRAAALKYRPQRDAAPRLVASGEGKLAERIIALAREHGVPITEDPDLVAILSKMDPGEMVSPELYEMVAELLVFIYRLKKRHAEAENPESNLGDP